MGADPLINPHLVKTWFGEAWEGGMETNRNSSGELWVGQRKCHFFLSEL